MNALTENHAATDKIIAKVTSVAAFLILILLLIIGGRYLWGHFRYEETNDAQIQEYINPVVTRVSGYIVQIKYEENEKVRRGDTLILIDKSQYLLHRQESQEAVLNARAEADVLRSTVNTYGQTANIAKARIEAARAKLFNGEQEYKRYKNLFDDESATQQQLDNRKAALDVAQSEYTASLESYQEALSRINDLKKQEAALLAEIRRRETLLRSARLDLSYTVITAPYDGKMGKKMIQTGEYIQANQSLAFIVNEEAGKWVVANFKETQVGKMKTGEVADIETDAFPGEVFHGRIESLSPATGSSFSVLPPDNSTGNFVKVVQRIPVRIALTDSRSLTDKLEGGMNATVRIKK